VLVGPAGLAFYGGHLLALALLAATAWVLGCLLSRSLPLAGVERVVLPAVLGVAGLGYLAFLLGLVHALTRPALLVALAALHLAGWRFWRAAWGALRGSLRRLWEHPRRWSFALLALLLVLPLFLLALYPPTAFDATLYHLPDARAFARSGALPFLSALRFPVFPQLDEVLFAAVLLLAGDVAVHLLQLLATLLTAGLLVAWGEAALSRRAGYLAAAAYLGSPIVVHLGTSAYVEAGLTLFTTAALYALWRYQMASGRASGSSDGMEDGGSYGRGWLALAAVFAASAAGVKYLGLFFLAAVALAVVLPRRRRLADLLLFAALAAALLAPVYGRILYYTGNPVFPFLPGLFGHSAWDLGNLRPPPASLSAALRQAVETLATLPWDVVVARSRTGLQPPYSPLLLPALPLLVFALRDRRVRPWLLLAFAYTAVFPLLWPDARYLLPALPLLCLALAAVLNRLAPARWGIALSILLLLPGWLYAGYRLARQGVPPATAQARERYLAARLPLYPALAWLNREGGQEYTVYAFFAENMTYFAAGTFLGDWLGPARFTELLPAWHDPQALWQRLRALGAGYLLVPRDRGGLAIPDSLAWRQRFRLVYADSQAVIFALAPADLADTARKRGEPHPKGRGEGRPTW
jgi:4-amino-4-deoxy-L-arabinose transferase-like glycosyltransferase